MSYRLSRTNPELSREVRTELRVQSKLFFIVEGAETEGIYLSAFQKQFLDKISGEIVLLDRIDITQSNQYIIVKTIERYQNLLRELDSNTISELDKIMEELSDDASSVLEKIEVIKKLIGEELYADIFANLKLISNDRSLLTILEALTAISELKYFDHTLDKIILVLDRDSQSFTSAQFDHVLEIAERNEYELGISNPCFELFLLLHLTDLVSYDYIEIQNNKKTGKSTYVEKILAQHLKSKELARSYKKSSYNAQNFVENFNLLKSNIDASNIATEPEALKSNIGTSLYNVLCSVCNINSI
ncbi:MAG: RloB domain-containing protein [Wohlfahrtiimonas sp.]